MVSPRFVGKVALVTGGAGDIGAATAETLGLGGARVVLADVDEAGAQRRAAALSANGTDAIGVGCDQTDPEQIERLFADHIGGRLDICVANAGYGRFRPFLDQDLASWRQHLDINLTGTFLVAQAAARTMATNRSGSIVINASTAAIRACGLFSAYSVSKAGVEMLARCMADELGPLGVRVNSVCPGVVETEMTGGMLGADGDGVRRLVEAETPLARIGEPRDVAAVIAFLASDDARFVTGASLLVDGGETLRGFPRWFVADSPETGDAQWRLATAPMRGTTPIAPVNPRIDD